MKTHKIFQIAVIIAVSFVSGTLAHATYQKSGLQIFQPGTVKVGQASWYSEKSPGIKKTTANMEIFDDSQLTCAMWEVPFNQRLRITNLENGKSVTVRVNHRGPHKRFVKKGRVVDLSKAAFKRIADLKSGLISVRVEFLS